MIGVRRLSAALVVAAAAVSCKQREPDASQIAESGGADSVIDATRDAFAQATPRLTEPHRRQFFVGNSFFNQTWVTAPASVATRDGLGPLFNATSCSTCHFKDGRSRPPEPGGKMETMLLRVSIPPRTSAGNAPLGDPVYGDQIQGRAIPGVPAEADVQVEYDALPGRFSDGASYTLARPRFSLKQLGYGAPAAGLQMSGRVAPALVGLGLLEGVPEAALLELADPDDRDHDGISGRVNRVPDVEKGRLVPGRFGWKAEQPTVRQQSAGAFLGDMGLTSSLFPQENCQKAQAACRSAPNGGAPEVEAHVLDAVALYARSLAVPVRRRPHDPEVIAGEALFRKLGCASCHRPTLRSEPPTDMPELEAQAIHPYTDLLLHDMGDGLSDGRPAFEADGREWRTPPLWGIGLIPKVNQHTRLLHDGRARTLEEAILWHGGEAEQARDRFAELPSDDRDRLRLFLQDL